MDTKIKLLYIIDSYKNPYAGTEGQLLKLIEGLDKNRFEARFLVFKESNYLSENRFPIPVDILHVNRLVSPFSWIRLFRYLYASKGKGFRIAHIFFNDASLICPPILKLLGYKVLISRRDMGYWYSYLNIPVLKLNKLFVDYAVANSDAVKKITIKKEGYKHENVPVIYNGYRELSKTGQRKKGDNVVIKEGGFRLIIVANIRPIKRIEDAIEAVSIVKNEYPDIELYIIGDGDQSGLYRKARDARIEEAVKFLGSRSDILDLLPDFDAGILCSESEGFSNTLIEYMQSSLPVICTRVGGNPEIVEHGVNGYLYEVGDTEKLAEYIMNLATDITLCTKMGNAGRAKITECYSLDNYITSHQRLYNNLIQLPVE